MDVGVIIKVLFFNFDFSISAIVVLNKPDLNRRVEYKVIS